MNDYKKYTDLYCIMNIYANQLYANKMISSKFIFL